MIHTIMTAMSGKDEEPAKPDDSDYSKSPNPTPGDSKTPADKSK